MNFNLADYEPVEARLARFWADHPTGRVYTVLESFADGQVVFLAQVFRDAADPLPTATGYAHEVVSQRGVNATSAVENCETSAIGRALANAGYATKGKRPSREEMAKANRPAQPPKTPIEDAVYEAFLDTMKQAPDLETLQRLGAEAATYDLSDTQRDTLRAAFLTRKTELDQPTTKQGDPK